VQKILASDQLEILTADDSETGLQLFFETHPRIVLVDALMPTLSGINILESITAADAGVEVILTTSNYSEESAIEGIQKGARDCLAKPLDSLKLWTLIRNIQAEAQQRERTAVLDRELLDAYEFESMIGRSPLMLEVFSRIRRVAPHFKTILVTGNTGTGKELVARALHHRSPAAARPFAAVNCSAVVETLLESELFGYVKGAFTGAIRDKVGVFEYAHGGTVFLDEIGELPIAAQAKLLRVLQNQEVQRVGSPLPRIVDVRVIAATNRDLKQQIAKGAFREDLYFRLAVVEVKIPPLADRKEDLPLIQRHLISKFSTDFNKPIRGMTRRAQACLAGYSWPGNVRELENVIGNACMMVEGDVIDIDDLPEPIRSRKDLAIVPEPAGILSLEQVAQRHVLHVLQRVGGNKLRAAEALGIGRNTLYEMLARIKAAEIANLDGNPNALRLRRQNGTG
jgi:DNA-binding NtrC family response regulator